MGTGKRGNALKAHIAYLALYPACLVFGVLAILLNIREDGPRD